MTLTITHTHEEGTLITGTAKGDGTAETLKAHRWRWGRSIGAWYIPHSRDKAAQVRRIEATAAALAEAGFSVAVEIDDTGSTRIGRYIFNHPFFVPGALNIAIAVALGFLFGGIVL